MSTHSGGPNGDGGGSQPPPQDRNQQTGPTSMTSAMAGDGCQANSVFQTTTPAWAGGGPTDRTPRLRSFAEIMADQKINRNILEIILKKKSTTDSDGNIVSPKNLNFDDLGTFLFDVLKIKAEECLRFNYTLGRYDTREVMFKPGVDISPYLGCQEFMGHDITTRKQRNNITKVTFKNVPLNIPDEEIIHLCETYGKPLDNRVHYEKLNNLKNKGMAGGTRFVEVEMFPGASMFNFYWMEGPLSGDDGSRVTVLHPGQIQQCSNCLKLAPDCSGKGNGKACVATGTPRTQIGIYMEMVKMKHGYRSLKTRYFEQFPNLGGTGTSGMEIVERGEEGAEDEIIPINPLEEKDQEIASLKLALEVSTKACEDATTVKTNLSKTKAELKALRWNSSVNKNKIDFARKVVEQSIDLSLSDSTLHGEKEKELVALYSTLVDEGNFELSEDETCVPKSEFLEEVEKNIYQRGQNVSEKESYENFKTKILEAVKTRKLARRSRKESFSRRDSVGSNCSMKRGLVEQEGTESSRAKLEIL